MTFLDGFFRRGASPDPTRESGQAPADKPVDATPPWFVHLNGQDDDLTLLPPGYDGRETLPDHGLAGLRPAARKGWEDLHAKSAEIGLPIRLSEGFRPRRRQAYLYALGRSIPNPDSLDSEHPLGGIVTKVLPGKSKHQSGLAFDIALVGKDPYNEHDLARVGAIGQAMGLVWGGAWTKGFTDSPHFEVSV